MSNTKLITLALAAFIIAIAFNVWLDSGCDLNGIITTHGKTCLN